MKRFTVEECFSPHLGFMSHILDRQTGRRILVAGSNHQARAAHKVERLEEEAKKAAREWAAPKEAL